MQKVIAILIQNENFNITDLLMKETENSVFLGWWGEITNNKTECILAISNAVNTYLQKGSKQQIVFACHKNDIEGIKEKLNKCDLYVLEYKKI